MIINITHKIERLLDHEIIVVGGSGTLSQEIRKETYLKAAHELEVCGFHRLLVDVTNSNLKDNLKSRTINTLDLVVFIYSNKIKTEKQLKIAVLSTDREESHKNLIKLAQLIVRQHIKYFRNRDEAINWLITN